MDTPLTHICVFTSVRGEQECFYDTSIRVFFFFLVLSERLSSDRNRAVFGEGLTTVKLTLSRSATSSFLMQECSYLLSCSPETHGIGL